MKLNVIVVTKTYSTTLGIIRSLGAAGYQVDLLYVDSIYNTSEIVSSSKYIHRTIVVRGRKEEVIIETLLKKYAKNKEQYFIFPTDDYAVSVIDRNLDRLKGFHFPFAGDREQGGILRLMDKSYQAELAEKFGFPPIKEWVIPLEKIEIPADVVFPCFVKPLVSAKGYKKELGACAAKEELEEKLKGLQAARADRSVLVQELLPITQEYSMSGLCLDQEIILPAIVKKLVIAQNERGVTLYGELVENETIAPVMEPLHGLLKSLHYTGMFDMEIFVAGEKIYFNEINLRSGGPNYSYFGSGVNLPDILLRYFSGEEYDHSPEPVLHKRFLYEKAAMEDVQKGLMDKSRLDELYAEADILLLDTKDDPRPGSEFRKFFSEKRRTSVKSLVTRLKSKFR